MDQRVFTPRLISLWRHQLYFELLRPWSKWKGVTNWVKPLNSLRVKSLKSDQHQFSRHNIHTLSKENIMRFNIMITSRKMLWSFIKFSQLIFKGNVWRSVWRICMWILGLKGLSSMPTSNLGVPSKFAQWFSRHLKEFKNLSMFYFAQLRLCR